MGRSVVAPGYSNVLRIPLLTGRDFTEQDDVTAGPVDVVNQQFAQRFFGDRSPIGHRFRAG